MRFSLFSTAPSTQLNARWLGDFSAHADASRFSRWHATSSCHALPPLTYYAFGTANSQLQERSCQLYRNHTNTQLPTTTGRGGGGRGLDQICNGTSFLPNHPHLRWRSHGGWGHSAARIISICTSTCCLCAEKHTFLCTYAPLREIRAESGPSHILICAHNARWQVGARPCGSRASEPGIRLYSPDLSMFLKLQLDAEQETRLQYIAWSPVHMSTRIHACALCLYIRHLLQCMACMLLWVLMRSCAPKCRQPVLSL